MRAVEWGSGSSSLWTLMRVGHLTTVEHDDRWAKSVEVAMNDTYGAAYLGQHWDSHVVPRGKPTHSGLLEHFDPDSFKCGLDKPSNIFTPHNSHSCNPKNC